MASDARSIAPAATDHASGYDPVDTSSPNTSGPVAPPAKTPVCV